MKILQCGYGNIGQLLFQEFQAMIYNNKTDCVFEKQDMYQNKDIKQNAISVYDPGKIDCPNKIDFIEDNHFDIAFICVPTERKADGSADTSIVLDLCAKISADIIVIKSTIPLTIIDKLPQNAIFSPEFTGTTPHSGNHPYVILGGNRGLCNKVANLYKKTHDASFKIVFTDIKTAIMAKYMENCFLALKVTFCNEMALACQDNQIEYDDVRNIFLLDSRINPSHTFVYADQPYYDSHCLIKDVSAFNAQFNLPLMRTVEHINEKCRQEFLTKGRPQKR